MSDARTAARDSSRDGAALADVLARHGEALPPPEQQDAFGAAFARFGGARIVLLGEASHGSAEFYMARAAITRELIRNHGFRIVAVEADWPDAARVDGYVRHRAARPAKDEAFARFPTWMWRNVEMLAFTEWLRGHNAALPPDRRTAFHGLDVYSLGASIAAVLAYLDRVDPAQAREARRRYGCLTPWQDDPVRYGRAVLGGAADPCEPEVAEQLCDLLERRLSYIGGEGRPPDGEAFFDAAQNARIVRAAEQYYRIMYRGTADAWNLRDRHMFDTLQALLRHGGPDARAVVWAHNSHIGNAAATAMGWQGEFNIGELCRTAWGHDAVAIGFGTDRGEVAAASDWDAPMEVKKVRPSRPDSFEHAFLQAGLPRSLTDWRRGGPAELVEALSRPRLERAIGVIYRPESERGSHYFDAVLADQFDAWVWLETTGAVTPLPAERPDGVPDTYPFGV